MGHTEEAAKYARRSCFALLDHFGLSSLFLSTTPDDECSFRVKLYSKPEIWVSQFVLALNSCFENNAANTHSYINLIQIPNPRDFHFWKVVLVPYEFLHFWKLYSMVCLHWNVPKTSVLLTLSSEKTWDLTIQARAHLNFRSLCKY